MRSLFFLLCALAVTGGGCSGGRNGAGLAPVVGVAMESVVRIRATRCEVVTDDIGTYPPRDTSGTGSGVVVDGRGYIVTCWHVVADARAITVDLDKHTLGVPAVLVAGDPFLDLALIRVDRPTPKVARWGDSRAARPGDAVFAVGFPFDMVKMAEAGIISATDQSFSAPVLTTDAAINPGHSGGGLFDRHGNLIGINSALNAVYGLVANTGIAYAIPGNTAHLFVVRNVPCK